MNYQIWMIVKIKTSNLSKPNKKTNKLNLKRITLRPKADSTVKEMILYLNSNLPKMKN